MENEPNRHWIRTIALASAVLTPAVAVLIAMLHWLWASPDTRGLIKEWQEFIAGLIALFAALLGIYFIRLQIQASDLQEGARTARRFRSARAGLPNTLSDLSDYAVACGSEIDRLYNLIVAGSPLPISAAFPSIPAQALSSLKELIEVGDDEIAEILADLLSCLQIQAARLRSAADGITGKSTLMVLPHTLESRAIDTAELFARSAALFPFARRQTGTVPSSVITAVEIKNGLHLTLPPACSMPNISTMANYYP